MLHTRCLAQDQKTPNLDHGIRVLRDVAPEHHGHIQTDVL